MSTKDERSHRRQFIDKRLLFRLRMFAAIFLLMLTVAIYETTLGYIYVLEGLGALLGGIVIGLIVGRTANVIWHEEAGKAITKMDILGGIILILYICFAILRKRILSHWLSGNALSAFVMYLSAGIMLGRLLSMRNQIIKILKQQDKF